MRSLLILLIPTALLFSSCTTGLQQIRDDVAIVAAKAKAGVEKIEAAQKALDDKTAAAIAEMRAKGAPVDGSPADLMKWAKENPLPAAGSPLAFLLALYAAWRRSRTATRALTATVDAAETLPPEAATAFRTAASQSTHMGTAETALIATLKAR